MKRLVLSGLCCAGLFALAPSVHAHGGQYRGPGDVVPPSPGGGRGTGGPGGPSTGGPAGPSTPGPSGPSTPGASGPSTGGPAAPGAGPGGPATGGGGPPEDDLTRWMFWWEFNKDPFIRLRDSVHSGGVQTGSDDFFLGGQRRGAAKDSMKPTEDQIMGEILPALKKAIDSTEDVDIVGAVMVAMAKVGKDHQDFKLLDVIKPRLTSGNQEICETAALAIGIAGIAEEEQINLLSGMALDNEVGRKATGRDNGVQFRTRTFALYGLGLLAYPTNNLKAKTATFQACKQILADDKLTERNIKVAAIQALSLLNLGSSTDAEKQLLADAVKVLHDYYMKPMGASQQMIQSHCATTIAKLVGKDHPEAARFKELFANDLLEKGKVERKSDDIARACVLALGQLCQPFEDKDEKKNPDVKYSEMLLDTYKKHKDQQTKFFSVLALGQIGGAENRKALLLELGRASKNNKPWFALSLGVYSYFRYEAQKKASNTIDYDRGVGERLYETIKTERTPDVVAALGVGLGLNQYTEAADHMRSLMEGNIAQEELAGYLCIGLALMNDIPSTSTMLSVVDKSLRRPDLLKQAAIALGKLGDKTVADKLKDMLMDDKGSAPLARLSAVASALGFIGDKRTIAPLTKLLLNKDLNGLSRAFAAVALGGVADKEPLPWNSKISVNINYRASVETLTNQSTGILDIL
jgi:hypothetical protein